MSSLMLEESSVSSSGSLWWMVDIRLINKRKGEGMWAMELRRWLRERMMGNKRKVRTIVEIVGDRSQL